MTSRAHLIDLTHTIHHEGMPIFPGYPQPQIKPFMSYAEAAESGRYEGCSCQIDAVSFVSSTGTYMDAPAHFFPGGRSVSDYSLDELIMDAVVLDCRSCANPGRPLDLTFIRGELEKVDLSGRALLLETGWSNYWEKQEYFDHPFLDKQTVDFVINKKPALVGMDVLVIDDRSDKARPAHCGFLGNNILIVENLKNLSLIRGTSVEVFFIPLKLEGTVSIPVRAFAREVAI
jgi:arylformamidase